MNESKCTISTLTHDVVEHVNRIPGSRSWFSTKVDLTASPTNIEHAKYIIAHEPLHLILSNAHDETFQSHSSL